MTLQYLGISEEDIFRFFKIDRNAWRYFHILCFEDMPGYFPQLKSHGTGRARGVVIIERK